MFGVLVVQEPGGRIGYLRSFSGMLGGRWRSPASSSTLRPRGPCPGGAPGRGGGEGLLARFEALQSSAELTGLRSAHAALEARHAEERAALRARHEENRRQRHARRAALTDAGSHEALHALDQQSRGDKAERRRVEAAQEEERRALESKRSGWSGAFGPWSACGTSSAAS